MKLCIDCKFYALEEGIKNPELGRCTQKSHTSRVTGLQTALSRQPWCEVERLSHRPCGADGNLFEAKENGNV